MPEIRKGRLMQRQIANKMSDQTKIPEQNPEKAINTPCHWILQRVL